MSALVMRPDHDRSCDVLAGLDLLLDALAQARPTPGARGTLIRRR